MLFNGLTGPPSHLFEQFKKASHTFTEMAAAANAAEGFIGFR
jgi:hypothetical protein